MMLATASSQGANKGDFKMMLAGLKEEIRAEEADKRTDLGSS